MALDGVNPLEFSPMAGWKGFELVSRDDDISLIGDSEYGTTASLGVYDGLGTFLSGNDLSVWINHETYRSAISRLELNRTNLQQAIASKIDDGTTPFPSSIATGMGYAYDTIFDRMYHAEYNPYPVATGTVNVGLYGYNNFTRFCSGTSYLPNSFAANRGFVNHIYLTGEETFRPTGQFYALDPTTRTLWEVPDLSKGSWENAALVDTGNTNHVALVLNEDDFPAPIRLYVGEKNVDVNKDGEIDFLERNGLRGGQIYFFDPDDGFDTTDLPDGFVTGTWNRSFNDALFESKIEDVHTNPHNGMQTVFAGEDDGVYTMDLSLTFANGQFDPYATVTIDQIVSNGNPITEPDNLTWSNNGKIYVQEDGQDGIWEINSDGTGGQKIAQANGEPSGIIDISATVAYRAGSVFLTSVQWPAQLGVLISPTATTILACDFTGDFACTVADINEMVAQGDLLSGVYVPPGSTEYDLYPSANSDGLLDNGDIDEWLLQAALTNGFATPYLRGDVELDRDVDIRDFNRLASNFDPDGVAGPHSWLDGNFDGDHDIDITDFNFLASNFVPNSNGASAVPEPAGFLLILVALIIMASNGVLGRTIRRGWLYVTLVS